MMRSMTVSHLFSSAAARRGSSLFGARFVWLTSAVLALVVAAPPAAHATTATTTTLGISSSSVNAKTVVTLTATVKAGSTAVTIGTVLFCDATANYCTDVHLLNAAQLIVTAGASQGTAIYKFIPGVGSHTYKATYVANTTYGASTSGNQSLTVTQSGTVGSSTTIVQSGSAGNYTLISATSGYDTPYPTGTVSFEDTSNGNAVLATAGVTSNANNPAFVAGATYAAGYAPQSSVTADFNGDGIPDIAVAAFCLTSACTESTTEGAIFIFLGNGDGTFRAGTTLYGYSLLLDIKAGDFNRDGNIDLVTTSENNTNGPCCSSSGNNYQQLQVFLGNGDGSFHAPSNYNMPVDPNSMAIADINNDGYLDIVITGELANGLTVYQGNGNGGFTTTTPSANLPIGTSLPLAAPFAGDGAPDLALGNFYGGTTITLLKNNGSGAFSVLPTITLPNSGTLSWMSLADITGDGVLDLLVTDLTNSKLYVYKGGGDGTFSLNSTTSISGPPIFVGTADFNNDGKADVYVTTSPTSGNGNYEIFTGNGAGGLTAATQMLATGPAPYFVSVADYNEDGRPDLAVVDYTNSNLAIALNQSIATASVSGVSVPGTGTHAIEASYPGDSYYAASTSGTTNLTGSGPDSTSTGLTLGSSTGTVGGTSISLMATVSDTTHSGTTPAASVAFTDTVNGMTTTIATVSLSGGSASTTYAPEVAGTHTINANFGATSGFNASTTSKTLTVSQDSPTPEDPSWTVAPGGSVVITVIVSYPGTVGPVGGVTFKVNGSTANLSGLVCKDKAFHENCEETYTAPSNMALGNYPISFSQAPDANYAQTTGSSTLSVTATGNGGTVHPPMALTAVRRSTVKVGAPVVGRPVLPTLRN